MFTKFFMTEYIPKIMMCRGNRIIGWLLKWYSVLKIWLMMCRMPLREILINYAELIQVINSIDIGGVNNSTAKTEYRILEGNPSLSILIFSDVKSMKMKDITYVYKSEDVSISINVRPIDKYEISFIEMKDKDSLRSFNMYTKTGVNFSYNGKSIISDDDWYERLDDEYHNSYKSLRKLYIDMIYNHCKIIFDNN